MKFTELSQLFTIHANKLKAKTEDPTARFRSIRYAIVAQKMKTIDSTVTIKSINELDISPYMKNAAIEFMRNKPVESIESILVNQMGIGSQRAKLLVNKGVTKLSDLKLKKYQEYLTNEIKLFIKYKPMRSIPNKLISKIYANMLKMQMPAKIVFVGSYRRNKPFSRDIDCMCVSDDYDVLDKVLEQIGKKFQYIAYSSGKDKISFLLNVERLLPKPAAQAKTPAQAKPPSLDSDWLKMDIFRSSAADEVAMLLYATGSKENNVLMRSRAKKMGYLLNQKGLFKEGKKIVLKKEEDYYKILKLPYREPQDR